jgi:hypothetical protein
MFMRGDKQMATTTKQTRTQQPKPRVWRFNTLGTAESFRIGSTAGYATLLGCDGLFWVPVSNRETGRLIRGGYEIAQ